MITTMYAVFDSAVGAYMRPFFHHTDKSAQRAFQVDCINADGVVSQSPGDYTLWRIAEWDDCTGVISPMPRQIVCTALEAIAQAQEVAQKGPNIDELTRMQTEGFVTPKQGAAMEQAFFNDERKGEGSEHNAMADAMQAENAMLDAIQAEAERFDPDTGELTPEYCEKHGLNGEDDGTTNGPHLQSSTEGEHTPVEVRQESPVSDDT